VCVRVREEVNGIIASVKALTYVLGTLDKKLYHQKELI